MSQRRSGPRSIRGMGLVKSLLAVFTGIVASCSTLPPEPEPLGQSEAALGASWHSTTSMPEPRRYHSATVLASEKVLVVGGWSYSGFVAGATTYDPASATWSPASSLTLARQAHTATRLSSGKVLVVGGETSNPYPANFTNTAELYDPATNSWSAAGTTSKGRGYNTATLLPANPSLSLPERVLIVGGLGGGPLQTVDLYNTATGTWSSAAPLLGPRRSHTAVRLASGKVLVAGGWAGGALATTELYEPSTNTWTAGSPLTTARYGHTVTELPSGKILVVGGQKDSAPGTVDFTASAEVYDPATNTWASAGTLSGARGFHTATLVGGKVLVAGGRAPGDVALASAEVYDPATNTWSSTSSLLGARSDYPAVYSNALGKVMVLGGSTNSTLATVEVYDADSCGSVVCNTPPGACYNAAGTCSSGTCSYTPKAAGASCNDGNACTSGDVCNGSGACTGTALSCSTASSYYCSGNDVRRSTGTGTCSSGVCGSTDSFVQTCPTGSSAPYCSGNYVYQTINGCSNGACSSSEYFIENCAGSSYGAWSACNVDACGGTGTQSRSVTQYTCSGGGCVGGSTSTETQVCSTPVVTCPAPSYGAWSACNADACGGTGTQSRSVTSYTCSGGGCVGSTSVQTQGCSTPVVTCPDGQHCSGGTCFNSCSGNTTWCNGVCVDLSSNFYNCGSCGYKCANNKFMCSDGVCEWR